jgi:hypothetical protein
VCDKAKLVSKSGERYAMNMGLQNLKVDTSSLWGKCKEVGDKLQNEIFNKFATEEGILDSDRLLEIAANPKAFQQLKHELVEKCIPKAQTISIQNEECKQGKLIISNLGKESHFAKPTISSLIRQGDIDKALGVSNNNSQKSFVKELEKRKQIIEANMVTRGKK